MRHTVIGKKENGKLEDMVFALARDLRQNRDFDGAVARLREFAPSDRDFMNAFATASLSRTEAARYVLRELEHDLRRTRELNVAPPPRIHVEHIYPQNPPEERRLAQHVNIINRIGNLTLLDRRLNTGAKNAAFPDKLPFYRQSELLLNVDIASQPAWGVDQITQRQTALSERAATIWSFPRPPEAQQRNGPGE